MTSYLDRGKGLGAGGKEERTTLIHRLWSVVRGLSSLLLLLIPLIYLATLAQTPVVGDPTEYTFVARVLGVAHPPGYAFMTLVTKLYQLLVPTGSIAWRSHLVGASAGTLAALCVFGIVNTLRQALTPSPSHTIGEGSRKGVAIFAAFIVALAANHWQHSIHANPHIITATFLAMNLYTLTKWFSAFSFHQSAKANRWLYAFCLSAGLGATHHPLTAFALPACVLFVLYVHPRILLDWKTLLKGTLVVLIGLLVWLYFPLRSAALEGSQFSSNMNNLEGFLDLVLARGLRVNLFAFGLRDQWDRATVFWTLLRLQHSLPVIFLALVGIGWLAAGRTKKTGNRQQTTDNGQPGSSSPSLSISLSPLLVLYLGSFALNYLFVMNTVQDVMAYLIGPFLMIGLFSGIGLLGLIDGLERSRIAVGPREIGLLLALMFVAGPGFQLVRNMPYISLRNYTEGNDYVAAVRAQFDGSGEGAVLLNDWEHMTPVWYELLVNEGVFEDGDIRPIFVSAAKPWLDHVFENLSGGPVYLSRFERSIFDAGFRIRARGADLWQVVEPGDASIPAELTPAQAGNGDIEIVGFDIPTRERPTIYPHELQKLMLAMRTPDGTSDIYVPVLHIGDEIVMPFTTDSHLLTNEWQPGEVIVEAFEFVLPPERDWHSGDMIVRMQNLSQNIDAGFELEIGTVVYGDMLFAGGRSRLLANFRQRVGLQSAKARIGLRQQRSAPWDAPIYAKSGETIHLTLKWEVLNSPEDSYTIFVHLIDLGNRPIIDNLDYTPLGGATPSHLWFPKWLTGQTMLDPYQMKLDDVPPGQYLIEVGIYEQFSKRRLHIYDAQGNINGDRFILGSVIVE